MKSRSFALCLVLLAPTLSAFGAAPAAAVAGVGIEPKLIATFTTATDLNSSYSSSSGTGYQVGVDFKWGSGFWIRPGAHWRNLNFELAQTATGGSDGVSLSGLYFPLVAGLALDLKIVAVALGAGPTYQHVASVGDNNFAIGKDQVDTGQFGAKVMGQASAFGLTLEGAYERGLENVLKDDTEYGDSKLDIWSIGLGMKF